MPALQVIKSRKNYYFIDFKKEFIQFCYYFKLNLYLFAFEQFFASKLRKNKKSTLKQLFYCILLISWIQAKQNLKTEFTQLIPDELRNAETQKLRLQEEMRQQNQKLRYFYYLTQQLYQMSQASPTKSMTNRLLLSKNIRLNFNSKFLPQDFFPESISQYCKSRKKNQKENQYGLSRKQSSDSHNNQDQGQFDRQAINFQLLKKRLVKIKESSPSSNESQSKRKISLKKRELSRKGLRKSIEKDKNGQNVEGEVKNSGKGNSKKLMDYMRKMKDVINIDIKFEEDLISPVYHKPCKELMKQNPEEIETDDSPKIQRFRPKSQINSRQRLLSKQKVKLQSTKPLTKPLKIKVRETSKLMRESQERGGSKGSERYNKFVEIQLNQQGMLTFYGSPEQKERSSYDSKKYKVRSSLPKLQK